MREILGIRRYKKAGYEVRKIRLSGDDAFGGPTFEVRQAFTPQGDYIGNPKFAWRLCVKMGIKPELRTHTSGTCSIGYCKREHKWYGWSHRAIYGFGIGAVVKKGDCTNTSGWDETWLKEHPECDLSLPVGFKAKSLKDARRMAIAFAESVS